MKNHYYLIAILAILLSINGNFYGNFVIIGLFILYYYINFKNQWWIVFIFLIGFNFHFSYTTLHKPTSNIVVIKDIKQNYVIAKSEDTNVYLYNVANVGYGDILDIEGKYEEIEALQNFMIFDFMNYSYKQKIKYQMYVKEYTIFKKNRSIKNLLYEQVSSIQNETLRSYLLQVLYQIKSDNYIELLFLSGFHLRFFIEKISNKFKRNKDQLTSVCMILYSLLFPVRFVIQYLFFSSLVETMMKHLNKINRFGVTILFLLMIKPNLIYELSFMVIFLFHSIQLFKVKRLPKRLIPILVMLPIQLFHFHEIYILLLIAYPFLQYMHLYLLISALISIVFPIFINGFTFGINIYQSIVSSLQNTYLIIGKPSVLWLIFWFYFVFKWCEKRRKSDLIKISLLLLYHINMPSLQLLGEIVIIDVGQGDCILMREPLFGKTIMIDVAGSFRYDLANEVIYPVLKARGIKKIDTLVISHDDFDHNGSLKELKNLIDIKQVATKLDTLTLTNIKLYNLNKDANYEDKNENSIVLYGSIYGYNYLFTGDGGHPVEKKLMSKYQELPVDILKVSHHGSSSATSKAFLHFSDPLLALISSGKNNAYGHPSLEVLNNLKAQETTILDTQTNGSIQLYFMRNILFVRTMRNEFGIMIKVKL